VSKHSQLEKRNSLVAVNGVVTGNVDVLRDACNVVATVATGSCREIT
jgi:hypothetical protein